MRVRRFHIRALMIAVAVVGMVFAAHPPAARALRRSQRCLYEAKRYDEIAQGVAAFAAAPPSRYPTYCCGNIPSKAELREQAENAARISRAYEQAAFRFWESPDRDPVIAREEEKNRESPLYELLEEGCHFPAGQRPRRRPPCPSPAFASGR